MPRFDTVADNWEGLWQSLTRARINNRLAHAFLIQSDLAESREEFALALAALAACPQGAVTGRPCGICKSCHHLELGTYPELHHLYPVGKAYQIQVGDRNNPEPNTLRHFCEQFFLTSTSGAARKVGIIHDADRMGKEAQNALLKTLEEPPPETLIILTTGNPSSLLPTTRSRCQTLHLPENVVRFEFDGAARLFAALRKLFFDAAGNLLVAEEAAQELIAIAASLQSAARENVENEWQQRIDAAAAVDPALAKRLGKQQDDAASGDYLRTRAAFLSGIHSYFAQLYLLSCGGREEHLANPEIMALPLPGPVQPERAALVLREAESLLFNLRFNVNEELALRNFAIQSARSN